MAGKVNADELLPETREKLGLGKSKVQQKVVVLGRLLQTIDGLTTRDALWALRTAATYARGHRKVKSKETRGRPNGKTAKIS